LAEDAEDCARGRAPRTGAPPLSSHAFKVFEGPAERSLRRAPRPRSALRVLRVNRLPLPLQFSAPLRPSAPQRETPARRPAVQGVRHLGSRCL